jgi:hypothetical protein
MESPSKKRATIYFDAQIHKALRLKAAESDRSVSDLVNEAVRLSLSEDAEDIKAMSGRVNEPRRSFADFVTELKDSGEI